MPPVRTKSMLLLLTIAALFLNSCKRDTPLTKINNLNGDVISAFGHAGMGFSFEYPVDSYESIEPVLRIGADGSEMDIQMTKDSVLVVYHDVHLEDGTICSTGFINDRSWSEIAGCHLACPYSSSINLVSFYQLMDRLKTSGKNIHDYTFTFDCKLNTSAANPTAFKAQYANAVLKAIDDYGLQDNIFIESQDTVYLRMLKNKRSGLKLFIYPPDFETGLQIAKSMGLFGITIRTDLISAAQVKKAHNQGISVTLWGVNTEKDNMDGIAKNPDFIQTDKPIHLLKVFGRYKG